jgi:alkanesulfonate monooxygenase SsuD/methylene tetrahydromethanopterin reductase-like flavin-dependent oxidoreductase (luciferase family)
MPDMTAPLKLGADVWNEHTDWPAFRDAHLLAEDLGYDSLWAPDHIYPPHGPTDGPILEPYMVMAPVAALTTRPTVGLMVSANTYRNPALLTKMVTTLDHISDGRAILAIGSAWSVPEHQGFGFEFGDSPGQRLRWLKEALPVIRGMLDGTRPTAAGDHYHMVEAINEPGPVQEHLPILIGGSGRKVTLRLVAEYADICNIGGTPSVVAEVDSVLIEHCDAIGRDERDIERSIDVGVPTIRDSRDDALLGQRRPRRRRLAVLRPVGHGQDDPVGRSAPQPHWRRRALLDRRRRVQHRRGLLRQVREPVARERAGDIQRHSLRRRVGERRLR